MALQTTVFNAKHLLSSISFNSDSKMHTKPRGKKGENRPLTTSAIFFACSSLVGVIALACFPGFYSFCAYIFCLSLHAYFPSVYAVQDPMRSSPDRSMHSRIEFLFIQFLILYRWTCWLVLSKTVMCMYLPGTSVHTLLSINLHSTGSYFKILFTLVSRLCFSFCRLDIPRSCAI